MAEPPVEALSANREVIVVLRLLIGSDGRIVHGHILDPGGSVAGPFRISGLSQALREWIGADPDVSGRTSSANAEK